MTSIRTDSMPPSLFRRVRLLLALAMVIPAAAPIPALGAPVSPTVLEISGGDEAAEWLAMAQAIRSTRLDVIAIVISRPAEATQAENLALRVRDLLKRPDIPVLVSDNQAIPASNLEIGNLPGKAQGEVEQGDLGERVVDLIEENGGNTQ
ncbi:MAG: hypothetical protein KC931_12700, partial [Candidatus Omnitrophica bacterium]|nr:hypothetical protein [Candidatus Omnitrophota bacterium]